MRVIALLLLYLLIAITAMAQSSNFIKGKVVQGRTGLPVLNASVFITNTSKGTTTGNSGAFLLENVPEGTYDLVVSCIGYETQVYTYKASQLPLNIEVQMEAKVVEMSAVVIEAYEKNGWEKWGKFFTENFIGTSFFANNCRIVNYKALKFRHSKKINQLTVTADEPLIIENKALGYRIQYQLEGFVYQFSNRELVFFGYTLFDDLRENGPRKGQLKNRTKSYNGSIAHFMRSLYSNRLKEEGFEVRRLVKTPNLEKERVKKKMNRSFAAPKPGTRDTIRMGSNKQQTIRIGQGGVISGNNNMYVDSMDYFRSVMKQPDFIETYGSSLLTADSLVTAVDSITKRLFFTDFLYIVFKKGQEEPEYLRDLMESRGVSYQRSTVFLTEGNAVFLDANGNYSMPQDFFSYGYWAWSEKIARMLPLDYKVE
jgi:CarboxypepD_reg-like domain